MRISYSRITRLGACIKSGAGAVGTTLERTLATSVFMISFKRGRITMAN